MSKKGYLPDENIPESHYMKRIREIVSGCTKANGSIDKYDYLSKIQNYQECMIQISSVLLDYFNTEDE